MAIQKLIAPATAFVCLERVLPVNSKSSVKLQLFKSLRWRLYNYYVCLCYEYSRTIMFFCDVNMHNYVDVTVQNVAHRK